MMGNSQIQETLSSQERFILGLLPSSQVANLGSTSQNITILSLVANITAPTDTVTNTITKAVTFPRLGGTIRRNNPPDTKYWIEYKPKLGVVVKYAHSSPKAFRSKSYFVTILELHQDWFDVRCDNGGALNGLRVLDVNNTAATIQYFAGGGFTEGEVVSPKQGGGDQRKPGFLIPLLWMYICLGIMGIACLFCIALWACVWRG